MSRRLKVDALAGRFDAVVHHAEEFRISWERVGRPVVPNLASSAYAVAMVHGIRRRRRWTRELGATHQRPPRCRDRD